LATATAALDATLARLAEIEQAFADASSAADCAREAERQAVAAREDAARLAGNVGRELHEAEARHARVAERLRAAEARLAEVDRELTEGELARVRLDEEAGVRRAALAELEAAQEQAREARVHWQVQSAQVEARLGAVREKAERAARQGEEAATSAVALAAELGRLEADTAGLEAQQAQWLDARAERRVAVLELEAAAADAEQALADAASDLDASDRTLHDRRDAVEAMNEEFHGLQLELSEVGAQRRRVTERLEAEWRRPFDELVAAVEPLELELDALEAEEARVVEALEAIGPVNPLAVEEHAEESKRLAFLTGQRDDLVAARQSLTQAIREIDTTARAMFQETFDAIRAHFLQVFQTLFGGGECDLRLATPDDPLESEIEIHAAPRGKRTQRIHLLSSGERTLVATSLLFAIYLTKPSPFCLMDEVDAPLDDANVGRFTTLLDEFKDRTQFIVITHNPRTMQAADAVYGVTMQEPGVSTIVGVRLGARAEA
jgi:chromosome segregation protein